VGLNGEPANMRPVIIEVCALLAMLTISVSVVLFLAIWSARGASATAAAPRQRLATDLAWAAIPCLTLLAAAVPALIAIVSSN